MADQTFPIVNKRAAITINDLHTEILLTGYSDKIFIVVTQYGRIGSLIQTTLDVPANLARNPSAAPTTSQFLLGESIGPQSDLYTLYATSISQAIAAMNPNESRPVLLGIALKPLDDMALQRQAFHQITDSIMANPVW
ncbi:hypothetical protein BCR42DRAFT_448157 [Absidia repens]|uniref:Uncharacterized protein n=1 Tax=Absidia repens TaxID=90262 RepID=A0A1X2IRX8_9FUNG|nr:hypothetical protein BCR42DRAFT_448157 [Absidia repens]